MRILAKEVTTETAHYNTTLMRRVKVMIHHA
jgi:hypothetical protein